MYCYIASPPSFCAAAPQELSTQELHWSKLLVLFEWDMEESQGNFKSSFIYQVLTSGLCQCPAPVSISS